MALYNCNLALPCSQSGIPQLPSDGAVFQIENDGVEGSAIAGVNAGTTANPGSAQAGVKGSNGGPGPGVQGIALNGNGVEGFSQSATSSGVYGENLTSGAVWCYGVAGRSMNGIGVSGDITSTGWAGYFNGEVHIVGGTHSPVHGVQIDHPLQPTSKYLNHSSIGSSEMKNVYDGLVTLDSEGSGSVELPAWFEALNGDFRYQLTPIGSHAPVYVADEITNNRFRIGGGKPGQKVSWQVTGIRRDAWASKHAIEVEEEKQAEFQGKLLHPVEAKHPREIGIPYLITSRLETMSQRRKRMEQKKTTRSRVARPILLRLARHSWRNTTAAWRCWPRSAAPRRAANGQRAAMRRASSLVSSLAVDHRPGS